MTPNKKINFFEPKPLAGTVNMLELRHTMFGAAFLTEGCGLSKVPKTNRASTLWEARRVSVMMFFVLIVSHETGSKSFSLSHGAGDVGTCPDQEHQAEVLVDLHIEDGC